MRRIVSKQKSLAEREIFPINRLIQCWRNPVREDLLQSIRHATTRNARNVRNTEPSPEPMYVKHPENKNRHVPRRKPVAELVIAFSEH
jgi:hypothetical protein